MIDKADIEQSQVNPIVHLV